MRISCWSGTGSPNAGAANAGTACDFSFPTGRCGCRIFPTLTATPTASRPAARSWISSAPMPISSRRRSAAAYRWTRYDAAMAVPALLPKPPSVRSSLTMSSSPPVPTSGRSGRPGGAMTPASFRCTPAGTETPINFHRARSWSSAPAPPARRSPRNCCGRAAASFSRSAGTAACRADTADAT